MPDAPREKEPEPRCECGHGDENHCHYGPRACLCMFEYAGTGEDFRYWRVDCRCREYRPAAGKDS